jgi:putative transposase
MTDDSMALIELLQKTDDADFLKSVAELTLERLMAFEVEGLCGAAKHERSESRLNYRNGYRARALDTRLGTLELRVPKLRQGTYFPPFLEPRKMSERALAAVVQEAWIGGVSTRRVDELVQALGMSGISKSQVSKLCREIDERVRSFLDRPLAGEWPYLWLDATYLKLREGGRIIAAAVIVAVAVNTDGRREIIGLGVGPSEAAVFWIEFLRGLVRRGLKGVKLVIADAHEGVKAAIAKVLGATYQRCRVHFMRNVLVHIPRSHHAMVAAAIRQVFVQPDRAAAGALWRHVTDQLRPRFPRLATLMEGAEHDVLAYLTFPTPHRTKLHSTNPLERLIKEIKRRTDVVGIFPNDASIVRLVGAVLLEQNDEWQLQHRYLSLETIAEIPAGEEPLEITQLPPKAA